MQTFTSKGTGLTYKIVTDEENRITFHSNDSFRIPEPSMLTLKFNIEPRWWMRAYNKIKSPRITFYIWLQSLREIEIEWHKNRLRKIDPDFEMDEDF